MTPHPHRPRRLNLARTATVALLAALLGSALAPSAWARIKLITLPPRERVVIQLDHPHATLVEEERIIPLTRGVNQVDFSWANTSIDPNTIVFRVLEPGDGAEDQQPVPASLTDARVLSVSYPPGEQALIWQVAADQAGSARVRISYLIGGLSESFNYRAVASQDESALTLRQYLRVRNAANENFGDTAISLGFGDDFQRPIGLNETREMLVDEFREVPIRKTYLVNPAEFGYLDRAQDKLNVPMQYVIANRSDNADRAAAGEQDTEGLGRSLLPAGKVRIFQRDPAGTTAFLGEDLATDTPVGGEMRLDLGLAQDVVVKRTIEDRRNERVAGNLFHHAVTLRYAVENFKDQPVTLSIEETIPHLMRETRGDLTQQPQWELGPATTIANRLVRDPEFTRRDRLRFDVPLPPRRGENAQPQELIVELVFRNHF